MILDHKFNLKAHTNGELQSNNTNEANFENT